MAPRTSQQFEDIRAEKRNLIINTALKLFADNGYHSTSISTIAKDAGISKGLIYNYFESKEDLLISIMELFIEKSGLLLNPNCDDEISNKEMENFFSLMIDSMRNDNELWKLQFQLSIQKEVFQIIKARMHTGSSLKHQQLIYKYFEERFTKPAEEMLLFSSMIKGFSLQYVFSPDLFTEEMINGFINKMKKTFIKEKI